MRLILEYWKDYVTNTAATNKTQRIKRIKRWVMQNQSASLRDLKRQFPEASDEELKAAKKTASYATFEEGQKEKREKPFYVAKRDKKIKGKTHYVVMHRPSGTYVPSNVYKMGRASVQGLVDELNAYNEENDGILDDPNLPNTENVKKVLDIVRNSEHKEDNIDIQEKQKRASCPPATQKPKLNQANKEKAANNPEIKYGYPEQMISEGKKCGNCAAFDTSEEMVACGGASEDKSFGYCTMHKFTCAAEKSCLTWADKQ